MKIESISHKGDFRIVQNGMKITELNYKNWFGSKAGTRYKSQDIEIVQKNMWCHTFRIFKNKVESGTIGFNWKGRGEIRLMDENSEELLLTMKARGIWKSGFEIINEHGEPVLRLNAKFNWRKFSHDYHIEKGPGALPIDEHELLLYCGFAAHQYLAMMSAV